MKTLKSLISEKRKNPKQNPKTGAFEKLSKYAGRNDIFISYTEKDKIGINPKSDFNTPIGIYTYPLAQVWKQIYRNRSVEAVPYAGRNPYIQVLQLNSKGVFVHDLSSRYTKSMYETDMNKLRKMYLSEKPSIDRNVHMSYDTTVQELKENIRYFKMKASDDLQIEDAKTARKFIKELEDAYDKMVATPLQYDPNKLSLNVKYNAWVDVQFTLGQIMDFDPFYSLVSHLIGDMRGDAQNMRSMFNGLLNQEPSDVETSIDRGTATAKSDTWGGKFWNVTRWASCGHRDPDYSQSKKTIVRWNKILQKLGYGGFADRSGKGIIHPNEPKQALFLATTYFDHVDTIDNKEPKIPVKANELRDIDPVLWPIAKDRMKDIVDNINPKNHSRNVVINPKAMPKLIAKHLIDNKNYMTLGYNSEYLFTFIGYMNMMPKLGKMFVEDVFEEFFRTGWNSTYSIRKNPSMMLRPFKVMGFKQGDKEIEKIFLNYAKYLKLDMKHYPKRKSLKDKIEYIKLRYYHRYD